MICVGYSKRTPCVGYMKRVGLKEQNDRIRAFAAEQGLKICKFYEDKSDDYMSVTGYDQLRKDGMRRQFDLVIFESLYRFGITVAEARNLLLHTFFLIGVHFIIIEDGIDSRNESEESLEKYLEEKNLEIMGRRSWNARRQLGHFEGVFGTGNYGYQWDAEKEEFIVDEEAASVIREIFELFLQGMPAGMIREYLTAKDVETPSAHLHRITGVKRYKESTQWDVWAVKRILREERYIGMTERDGYSFPEIISSAEFHEVASRMKSYIVPEKDELLIAIRKKCSFIDPRKKVHIYECRYAHHSVKYVAVVSEARYKVSREELIRQITRRIRMEKRICQNVCKRFETEAPAELLEAIEASYRSQARILFERSVEAQKDNFHNYKRYRKGKLSERHYFRYHDAMLQEIKSIDDEFSELLESLKYRRKQISLENEWIQRFLKVDENALTAEVIREILSSILIREDGTVEVKLNTKGKEVFPKTWTALHGGVYGTKE